MVVPCPVAAKGLGRGFGGPLAMLGRPGAANGGLEAPQHSAGAPKAMRASQRIRRLPLVARASPRRTVPVAAAAQDGGGSIQRNDAYLTGPLVTPRPGLSPRDVVRLQLEALRKNDVPRRDHGLEVLYSFLNSLGGNLGGGNLSRYYGKSQDLYHFGHFAYRFKDEHRELWRSLESFELEEIAPDREILRGLGDAVASVRVLAFGEGGGEIGEYVCTLSRHARGKKGVVWLVDYFLTAAQHEEEMAWLAARRER